MRFLYPLLILLFLSTVHRAPGKVFLVVPPRSIELAEGELAVKTKAEQVGLLSIWRKDSTLTSFCNQRLDELYQSDPTLFEDIARSFKYGSSARAVSFEMLRRHRNFSVNLSPDDKRVTKFITSYERMYDAGIFDFRWEWIVYRLERAENPQEMLHQIKAAEPNSAMFFEDAAKFVTAKTGRAPSPTLSMPERPATAQQPLKEPDRQTSLGVLPVWIMAVVTASGGALLWLVFKNRRSPHS